MKKSVIIGLFAVMIMALCTPVFAATIDFEGMPQDYWYYGGQQNFGNYWAGVNFGPASTILEDQIYGYNDYGYPPHSGHAVLFSISVPSIRADFDSAVDEVSLWYTSTSDFYLDAYDSSDSLIAQAIGGSNYTTNSYLSISLLSSDIAYVIMHDSGNYFTIDDFSAPITTGNPRVPEPSTIILLGAGLAGLGIWRRRS